MPDEEPVVWPDDPVEEDAHAEAASAPAESPESDWAGSFEEALKPAPTPGAPTQPSVPAVPAKTVPPEPAPPRPTQPAAPVLGVADEAPTSTFKTPVPGPADRSAANGSEAAVKEEPSAAPIEEEGEPASEVVAEAAPAAEPETGELEALKPEPVAAVDAEPAPESEKAAAQEPEAEPVLAAAEPEPAAPAPEPEPEPEPVKAAEPEPAPKADEWIPMPLNPPLPSWAPQLGVAIQHPIAAKAEASAPAVPAWAPPSTSSIPAASRQQASTSPSMPAAQPSRPPAAPAPAPAAQAGEASRPKTSSWEVVQQKPSEQEKQAYAGPTPEDKSYAEWFAWAKRSGAPASACHAAAQGAFRALAAGNDMNTAVQWATLAMAQPPGLVSASRQLYCAWYSLGNIDLKLPTPQAHAFATGAIGALEGGADAPTAHQAGLAAAGVIAPG